tara:strand:+ start:443 stop:868 length:426 start_codon:yes stop_codon:yes gene_type:complete
MIPDQPSTLPKMERLESSAYLRTFHLFPELPNELKDMVWKHIISIPRVTEMMTEACPWEMGDYLANFATRTRKVMFIQPPIPLLFVCKGSREVCNRRDEPSQEVIPGIPIWGTWWKVGVFPNYSQSFYAVSHLSRVVLTGI